MDVRDLSDAQLEAIAAGDQAAFTRATAEAHGVRPGLALSLRQAESGGDQGAVSPKGARGQMQLMPGTARALGVNPDDPYENIVGGVRYLRQQLDDFGGDERLALAAYNAGPNAVREHGGVPPYRETHDYIGRVLDDHRDDENAHPDITQMSDEDLEAIAGGEARGKPTVELGDVEFAPAPGRSAMRPGAPQKFVYADSDSDFLTPGQAAFYEGEIKAGRLDPEKVRSGGYRAGSEAFPLAQRDPRDLPKPGDFYITPQGEKKQVPADPMANTALHALAAAGDVGLKLTIPGAPSLEDMLPADPRFSAMERAAQSGALLGGRNEIVAGLESVPALFEGGVPAMQDRFADTLAREDRASAQARRDFPLAYDASAAGGALASGVAIPEGLAARLATGAGAGFLSTDGDLKDRAVGAALGAAGGEALNLVLPRVAGAVANVARIPRSAGPSQIAEAGDALSRMGVNIEGLPALPRATLERELRAGAVPADAAILALNDAVPLSVPLKRGDVTGLPADQLEFNVALRGANRNAAAAQGLAERQQEALRANVAAINDRLANPIGRGEEPVRGQAGARASEALAGQREAMRQQVNANFDAAREGSGRAVVPWYDMQPLVGGMIQAVTKGHALRDVPKTAGHLRDLLKMADATTDGDVRNLYDVRARLSGLRAEGGAEGVAAGKAISAFDAKVRQIMDDDLLHGDPAAVERWRTAIGSRREMGELFEQGDLVDRLTATEGSGNAKRLVVDPEEAANLIFGRSALGFGRRNLYRDLSKVRDLLGADSDAWNGLRAEAFTRIADAGEGAMEGGSRQFSGAKFAKAWEEANRKDRRLMDLLFTPQERTQIDAFAALSSRITNPVKGGDNPSNTAMALKHLKSIAASTFAVGKAAPVIGRTFEWLEAVSDSARARASMKPIPRRQPVPVRGVPAIGGGFVGAELATPN